MTDVELSTDLTVHAKQLDAIGDGLQQAVDAANQVSMPTDAYGILCQPFRMMLDPVEQYGVQPGCQGRRAGDDRRLRQGPRSRGGLPHLRIRGGQRPEQVRGRRLMPEGNPLVADAERTPTARVR